MKDCLNCGNPSAMPLCVNCQSALLMVRGDIIGMKPLWINRRDLVPMYEEAISNIDGALKNFNFWLDFAKHYGPDSNEANAARNEISKCLKLLESQEIKVKKH